MKKLITIILFLSTFLSVSAATEWTDNWNKPTRVVGNDHIINNILPGDWNSEKILNGSTSIKSDTEWLNDISKILVWVKDSMSSIFATIAIWYLLFIWARLVAARWNQEEFKKAMTSLIYAFVGIFAFSAAWAIISMISRISFN